MSALEVVSGAENLPECHSYGFLGPRISFSTDFGLLDSDHHQQQQQPQHIEWSTEFEFFLAAIEQQPGSPADEIFSDGKLLPLQLLAPSSRIQLVRKLLEAEFPASSAEQSRESSLCPSPILTPGSSSEFPNRSPGAASIHKKSSYSLKLVKLFRRSLGESGKSVDGEPQKSTVLFPELSSASSSPASIHTRKLYSSSMSSGTILWRNLERCSRSCAEQGRLRGPSVRRISSEKSPGSSSTPSSFSSNVRVAPVLNVPICMGPVKEKSSSSTSSSSSSGTISGLRKLKKGLQWSCPGGTI